MTKKQSVIKTVTWRVLASSDTFLIGIFVIYVLEYSGVGLASAIAAIEIFNKLFLYYFHERAWVLFSRRQQKFATGEATK